MALRLQINFKNILIVSTLVYILIVRNKRDMSRIFMTTFFVLHINEDLNKLKSIKIRIELRNIAKCSLIILLNPFLYFLSKHSFKQFPERYITDHSSNNFKQYAEK